MVSIPKPDFHHGLLASYESVPTYIDDNTRLRAPAFTVTRLPGGSVALDPARPNWIASDDRGMHLLGQFDGRTPFAQIVRDYAAHVGL